MSPEGVTGRALERIIYASQLSAMVDMVGCSGGDGPSGLTARGFDNGSQRYAAAGAVPAAATTEPMRGA